MCREILSRTIAGVATAAILGVCALSSKVPSLVVPLWAIVFGAFTFAALGYSIGFAMERRQNRLQIHSALYGSERNKKDVTARVQSQQKGNRLNIPVENDSLCGDPAFQKEKRLTVVYSVGGNPTRTAEANEHDHLILP
jgi:hypothetical protein